MTGDVGSSSNGFPLPLVEKGLPLESSSDQSGVFSTLPALHRQTEPYYLRPFNTDGTIQRHKIKARKVGKINSTEQNQQIRGQFCNLP